MGAEPARTAARRKRAEPAVPPAEAPARPAWPLAVWIGLAVTLVLLLAHAWSYRFLTDDAFISFRYARHFAEGAGLVFNRSFERVEGYSNFLWVLMLAAATRLGGTPESAATPLSLAATVALWWVVVRAALRRPRPEPAWLVLIPAAMLALFRSVALWSSSGLETRLFELLAVGAALRQVEEVESLEDGGDPRLLSGWAWGLACLTRPDGMLLASSAMAVSVVRLWVVRRWRWRVVIGWAAPLVALVAAHLAFRRVYYGEWVPNTYFAKVGGRWWWSSGGEYLLAFAIEYALPLWLAVAAVGVVAAGRRRRSFFALMCAAIVVPQVLYVAAVGGDHFEYRPLDLVFPFLGLLVYDGARVWARRRAGVWSVAAVLVLAAVLCADRAAQSRRQFPEDYLTGYPGTRVERSAAARHFLDPDSSWVYRWPGLHALGSVHQHLVRSMTSRLVAIRQEEHRAFLATVIPEGLALHRLIAAGVLPRDLHVAVDCVGAIPYYSGARTLDRLGLTDAHVAHGPWSATRVMAHDKHATMEYAIERGVDLWADGPVHLIRGLDEISLLNEVRSSLGEASDTYAAPLPDSRLLVCRLPLGLEATARRTPRLHWFRFGTPEFTQAYLMAATRMFADSLTRHPADPDLQTRLAYLLLVQGERSAALDLYTRLSREHPDQPGGWLGLAECAREQHDAAGEQAAMVHARAAFAARGDSALLELLDRDGSDSGGASGDAR